MVEELAKRYAAIVAEKEAQLQIIKTQRYCNPQSAAMAAFKYFQSNGVSSDFMPLLRLKVGTLLKDHADIHCMFWLQAHYLIHYYKEKLPESQWDEFLDNMSWFPGAAIERVLRARKVAEDRRRHLLVCW